LSSGGLFPYAGEHLQLLYDLDRVSTHDRVLTIIPGVACFVVFLNPTPGDKP
jgi:hypothetical protein